jgi:arylsulfatase B
VQESENLTTAFSREASDFITRNRKQPFFLMLAYNAVHSPLQADDRYLAKFSHIDDIQRRIFAAMLSHLDDGVGQVVKTLQEHGIDKNTLVILLSDNGGATKELTSSNHPLRGGKGNLYEGGIRVPMLASWPGTLNHARISTPVISTDIVATVTDILAKKFPTNQNTQASSADESGNVPSANASDGISWIRLLDKASENLPKRDLYWRMGKRRAIRRDNWKAISNDGHIWELYDLAIDLTESNNLSDRHPEVLTQLIDGWDQWNAQQAEPLWK